MPSATVPAQASPPQAKRWRDLRKRFLSAIVLGPAAILAIWLGAIPFTVMMAVCMAVLTWEWVHLCGMRTRVMPGLAVPVAVFVACAFAAWNQSLLAWVALLVGFGLAWLGAAHRRKAVRLPDRPMQPALRLALGVIYIGIAGLCLIELRHDNEAGRDNVLFLIAVVWATDTGAYLAGRFFGGPKLWAAVSPGKTWSGALGGLVTAALIGGLVGPWLSPNLPPGAVGRAVAVALILSVATQGGDLLESGIKRHFKVKDTSSLIPGHGGLLDRLDGVLAAAPAAALLALAMNSGGPLWR